MGKKKSSMLLANSDSDLEVDDEMAVSYTPNYVEDDEENNEEFSDDDYNDFNENEGDEEEEENENTKKDEELEELEKERRQLENKEQDVLSNLKRHKDEDAQKGQAVKKQLALWDKALEFRLLLQKAYSCSNRLPQEPVMSLFCESGNGVSEAYSDVISSSKKTLNSILELQQALLVKNPSITQAEEGITTRHTNLKTNGDIDEEWLQILEMQARMSSFRNKSVDKWHNKTQMTTGAAAMKHKLHAFNQSISEQVADYMRDPSKMVKGMQQNRSAVAVFGNVPISETTNGIEQNEVTFGDPELLDDSEFYQQLIKELLASYGESASEMAMYALKRTQTKKRKIVDRRASKSRKIRYTVHEKIVNFMAPRPMDVPEMANKLLGDLFGLKHKKPTLAT